MGPNAELAYRVLDHIDAHPEQWNQGSWWCGTGGCFAGWAVVLAGHTMVPDDEGDYTVEGADEGFDIAGVAVKGLGIKSQYAEPHPCPCGCGSKERDDLFSGANDREDLGRLVAEIFGPRPRPWTPDEKTETGTRGHVKRACNGCGELIGDVTDAEMDRAVAGLPAEDVRAECPRCWKPVAS